MPGVFGIAIGTELFRSKRIYQFQESNSLRNVRCPDDVLSMTKCVVDGADFGALERLMDAEKVDVMGEGGLFPASLLQKVGKSITDIVPAAGKAGQGQGQSSFF